MRFLNGLFAGGIRPETASGGDLRTLGWLEFRPSGLGPCNHARTGFSTELLFHFLGDWGERRFGFRITCPLGSSHLRSRGCGSLESGLAPSREGDSGTAAKDLTKRRLEILNLFLEDDGTSKLLKCHVGC